MNQLQWEIVTTLFDRLLAGVDPAEVLDSGLDPAIRRVAEDLWLHHLSAAKEDFLGKALDFKIRPAFQPGATLLNRFRIEKALGNGGMGEVYLAFDNRLEERVAIKTVARLLAHSPAIRKRFVAEVQSARRVTHPNVCRIHELFEDGETVFFSMEYIAGQLLPDALARLDDNRVAARVVRQMAEGLLAAHRTGVIHGDFKPSNVMLTNGDDMRPVIMDFGLARALNRTAVGGGGRLSLHAGTGDYMAPELNEGAQPTIASDIFAFGKVAQQLLPGEKIWNECIRADPNERPDSLENVIQRLQPQTTRRIWIAAATLGVAGAARYAIWPPEGAAIPIPSGARVMINGFQCRSNAVWDARLTRSLVLTSLQQSPRIHAISDQDLLPALRRLQPDGHLPLAGEILTSVLTHLRAAFWVEAELQKASDRLSLTIRILRSLDRQLIEEHAIRDRVSVSVLARDAAFWLRNQAGESRQSLALNPVAASGYTSETPEALAKYYDAMEYYAVAEMEQAIPLLRDAVRLDGNFAQAHSILAMCLNSLGRFDESFAEIERAMDLSRKLPVREKAWIETNHASLTDDPIKMIETARQNVAFYPDEARFYRVLARNMVRVGNATEALPYSRRAIEISPDEPLLRNELVVILCEAGLFNEALQAFEARREMAAKRPYIHRGQGLALMGLERYPEAVAAFEKIPGPEKNLWIQTAHIMAGDLNTANAALREESSRLLQTGGSILNKHYANEFLCGLNFVMGRTSDAVLNLRAMVELPIIPGMARLLDTTAFWSARLGMDAVLNEVTTRLEQIAAKWPNGHTTAMLRHAQGLQFWRGGATAKAEETMLQSFGAAVAVWSMFDLAGLYASTGRPDLAEAYWEKVDAHRGTILARMFPGALILGWLGRAQAARARGDNATAAQFAKRVLDHWSRNNAHLRVVQMAGSLS